MALEGPVSRLLNRRLSRPLALLAKGAGLSPNQVTGLSTGVATAVPLLFVMNRPRLAGAVIQAASVADGVDGDLARRTGRATQFGAVLDAVTDRYADAAILAGMTWWSARHERMPLTGLVGLSALVGSLMVSYARARVEAETKDTLDPDLRGHATRDVRLALAAAGSMSRQVYLTLVALSVLTNVSVARRMVRLYRGS